MNVDDSINITMLKNSLICAVCLEIPRKTPALACTNGHNFCEACVKKLKECPTCRVKVVKWGRSLLAENFIQSIPHPCENKERGCTEEGPLSSLLTHSKECKFRMVRCPYIRCKAKNIQFNLLEDHFSSQGCVVSSPGIGLPIEEGKGLFADRNWPLLERKSECGNFYVVSLLKDNFVHMYVVGLVSEQESAKYRANVKSYTKGKDQLSLSVVGSKIYSIDKWPEDVDIEKSHGDIFPIYINGFLRNQQKNYRLDIFVDATVSLVK